MVLAPEHSLLAQISNFKFQISNKEEVQKYIEESKNKTEIDRTAEGKDKIGVELKGVRAINPANGEEIPVWIADYVLANYGTGAIMAVPAHDERDFTFAKKYNLPIKKVIGVNLSDPKLLQPIPSYKVRSAGPVPAYLQFEFYTGEGFLISSGKFTGMPSEKAKKEITEFVGGKWVTKYKLRDWVFSRQRYWGEPIPVLRDGDNIIPLQEKDLPLTLPKITSYEPTGAAESPLAGVPNWINVKVGKKTFKRESNTMPQWAGSSWYYLRYMDPKNSKALVDKKKEKYWNEVDLYVGGAEHAARHLIYARFWHKFLYDIGVVSTKEPFKKLQHVGLIIASDGRKMSKRWGNVINPENIISTYGADTLRMHEMFMGPFDQSVAWNEENIIGVRRFLEKVWRVSLKVQKVSSRVFDTNRKLETLLHKTIQKVSDDIATMSFNTAISAMMILVNEFESSFAKGFGVTKKDFEMFLKILSPFAPHISEELWQNIGNKQMIMVEKWPVADPEKLKETEFTIAVSVDGKVRAEYTITLDMAEKDIIDNVKVLPVIAKWLRGKEVKKAIYVKQKLVNFVTT